MIIEPDEKDLGGFSVRRSLPDARQKMVGPWIFFDHMGPAQFAVGQGIDVRPHPHIGLATVTYLFEGEILHRDNLGYVQAIQPGAINLMVAGRGIVHSERTAPAVREAEHRLHGLQLWLALPDEYQEIEPAFYHYSATEIPGLKNADVDLRVMIGEAYGLVSPVKTYSPTLYVEAKLKATAPLVLPDTDELAIYVVNGELEYSDTILQAQQMLILEQSSVRNVKALSDAHVVMIGGSTVGQRYIWWNYVSNSRQRIEKAKKQWQQGEFAEVPGESEFIPLPD